MYLCTPGPTPIPSKVQEEMSLPMIHHRSKDFQEIFGQVRTKINQMLGNDGETVLLSSSGSGGLEASVASILKEDDHVVVIESGKFGQRWVELANRYKLQADVIQVQWGQTVTIEQIQEKMKPTTRALLTQACETSTGVFHPIDQMGNFLKDYPDCLFVVDGITAIGVHDMNMRSQNIDVLVGGSQKALMCPPGVSTVSLSQKALGRVHTSQVMYLSLEKELKSQVKNTSAFTPAVSIIRGLNVALDMMLEEGLANVYQRHRDLSERARSIFRKAGLPLLNADEDAAYGITAVGSDLSWDVGAWLEECKNKYGLWIAGGQEHLKGKIFRYAHMGHCSRESVDHTLGILFSSLESYIDVPSFDSLIQG